MIPEEPLRVIREGYLRLILLTLLSGDTPCILLMRCPQNITARIMLQFEHWSGHHYTIPKVRASGLFREGVRHISVTCLPSVF